MEKQYKVKVTVRAEQSLREISHYIAVDLTEPQAAVKLLRTLQKALNSLDMFPHRGSSYTGRTMAQSGHSPLGKQKLLYLLLDR